MNNFPRQRGPGDRRFYSANKAKDRVYDGGYGGSGAACDLSQQRFQSGEFPTRKLCTRTRPFGIGPTKPGCIGDRLKSETKKLSSGSVGPSRQGQGLVSPDDDRPTEPGGKKVIPAMAGRGEGRKRTRMVATGKWAAPASVAPGLVPVMPLAEPHVSQAHRGIRVYLVVVARYGRRRRCCRCRCHRWSWCRSKSRSRCGRIRWS